MNKSLFFLPLEAGEPDLERDLETDLERLWGDPDPRLERAKKQNNVTTLSF